MSTNVLNINNNVDSGARIEWQDNLWIKSFNRCKDYFKKKFNKVYKTTADSLENKDLNEVFDSVKGRFYSEQIGKQLLAGTLSKKEIKELVFSLVGEENYLVVPDLVIMFSDLNNYFNYLDEWIVKARVENNEVQKEITKQNKEKVETILADDSTFLRKISKKLDENKCYNWLNDKTVKITTNIGSGLVKGLKPKFVEKMGASLLENKEGIIIDGEEKMISLKEKLLLEQAERKNEAMKYIEFIGHYPIFEDLNKWEQEQILKQENLSSDDLWLMEQAYQAYLKFLEEQKEDKRLNGKMVRGLVRKTEIGKKTLQKMGLGEKGIYEGSAKEYWKAQAVKVGTVGAVTLGASLVLSSGGIAGLWLAGVASKAGFWGALMGRTMGRLNARIEGRKSKAIIADILGSYGLNNLNLESNYHELEQVFNSLDLKQKEQFLIKIISVKKEVIELVNHSQNLGLDQYGIKDLASGDFQMLNFVKNINLFKTNFSKDFSIEEWNININFKEKKASNEILYRKKIDKAGRMAMAIGAGAGALVGTGMNVSGLGAEISSNIKSGVVNTANLVGDIADKSFDMVDNFSGGNLGESFAKIYGGSELLADNQLISFADNLDVNPDLSELKTLTSIINNNPQFQEIFKSDGFNCENISKLVPFLKRSGVDFEIKIVENTKGVQGHVFIEINSNTLEVWEEGLALTDGIKFTDNVTSYGEGNPTLAMRLMADRVGEITGVESLQVAGVDENELDKLKNGFEKTGFKIKYNELKDGTSKAKIYYRVPNNAAKDGFSNVSIDIIANKDGNIILVKNPGMCWDYGRDIKYNQAWVTAQKALADIKAIYENGKLVEGGKTYKAAFSMDQNAKVELSKISLEKDKGAGTQKLEKPVETLIKSTLEKYSISKSNPKGLTVIKGILKESTVNGADWKKLAVMVHKQIEDTVTGAGKNIEWEKKNVANIVENILNGKGDKFTNKNSLNELIASLNKKNLELARADDIGKMKVSTMNYIKKIDSGKMDPSKIDPSKIDPSKIDPSKIDPSKIDPSKIDSGKVDSGKVDPSKIDSGKVDPSKIDSGKVDPSKIDSSKVDPSKIDSSGNYFGEWIKDLKEMTELGLKALPVLTGGVVTLVWNRKLGEKKRKGEIAKMETALNKKDKAYYNSKKEAIKDVLLKNKKLKIEDIVKKQQDYFTGVKSSSANKENRKKLRDLLFNNFSGLKKSGWFFRLWKAKKITFEDFCKEGLNLEITKESFEDYCTNESIILKGTITGAPTEFSLEKALSYCE